MRLSTAGVAEQDGTFLVAKRKPGTSIGELWEFPGGKVRESETPQEALIRELKEELNIEVTVGELLCTGTFTNQGTHYKLLAYSIRIENPAQIHSLEHQKTAWVSMAGLKRLAFPDSDAIIVEALSRQHSI